MWLALYQSSSIWLCLASDRSPQLDQPALVGQRAAHQPEDGGGGDDGEEDGHERPDILLHAHSTVRWAMRLSSPRRRRISLAGAPVAETIAA